MPDENRRQLQNSILRSALPTDFERSLDQLWYACENAWPRDVTRIVQDFTDHGPEHCLRVLNWLLRILEAGGHQPLDAEEAYVLLAAVYLHDIGMQCDIANRREVQLAVTGAGVHQPPWTAPRASDYSIEEQAWVRKNHALLTAEWLKGARQWDDEILGRAAESIPTHLFEDIIDVVLHHTGKPVSDCPERMETHRRGRKRFVAALMRLADELDIDSKRVTDPKVVQQFAMDADDAKYWWLHNLTRIDLTENNLFLTVALHPRDYHSCLTRVKDAIVNRFREKNASLFSILADFRVGLVFSSEVRKNPQSERLPNEIHQLLNQDVTLSENPTQTLVSSFMTASGFEVVQASHPVGPSCLCVLDGGMTRHAIQVVCSTSILVDDVSEAIENGFVGVSETWLVSSLPVSKEASELSRRDSRLAVMDLRGFMQRIWNPYEAYLDSALREMGIEDAYEDPPCYQLVAQRSDRSQHAFRKESHESLGRFTADWLRCESSEHLMVLGSFGSGKTSFAHKFAQEQLRRFLSDPVHERAPVLLSLRDVSKAVSIADFITARLTEEYRLRPVGSAWRFFDSLNQAGRLVVILDGFDEMAQCLDDESLSSNFAELLQLAAGRARMLLTSRTECFRRAAVEHGLAEGTLAASVTAGNSAFGVIYIAELEAEQVRRLIRYRTNADNRAAAQRILEDPDLLTMARKPVLIDMLFAALEDDPTQSFGSYASVYSSAISSILRRNQERSMTGVDYKLAFLAHLGWRMLSAQTTRVHFSELRPLISELYGETEADDERISHLEYDMRTQTMLHRDAMGHYEFAHKSFADYFGASYVAGLLEQMGTAQAFTSEAESVVDGALDQSNVCESIQWFLPDLLSRDTWQGLLALGEAMVKEDDSKTPVPIRVLFVLATLDTKRRDVPWLDTSDIPARMMDDFLVVDGQSYRGLITKAERSRQMDDIVRSFSKGITLDEVKHFTCIARRYVEYRMSESY